MKKFTCNENIKLEYASYLSNVLNQYEKSDSLLQSTRLFQTNYEPILAQLIINNLELKNFQESLYYSQLINRNFRGVTGQLEERLYRLNYLVCKIFKRKFT